MVVLKQLEDLKPISGEIAKQEAVSAGNTGIQKMQFDQLLHKRDGKAVPIFVERYDEGIEPSVSRDSLQIIMYTYFYFAIISFTLKVLPDSTVLLKLPQTGQ